MLEMKNDNCILSQAVIIYNCHFKHDAKTATPQGEAVFSSHNSNQ